MLPCACPSFPCGVYSTVILLNVKLTCSKRSVASSSLTGFDGQRGDATLLDRDLRNSSAVLPALRCVSTALAIISLLRSAAINGVEALSTRLTIFRSRMLALPLAVPPPSEDCDPSPTTSARRSRGVLLVLRLALDGAGLGALDRQKDIGGPAACSRVSLWHVVIPYQRGAAQPKEGLFDSRQAFVAYPSLFCLTSYLKNRPASSEPSSAASSTIFEKFIETLSIGCSLLPEGCTLVMRMSFILMIRYSCWPFPALRETSVPSLMCSPVAHLVINTGDALSTACMMLTSLKLALPAPPPPPIPMVPVCVTPNDHDSISISPGCLSLSIPLDVP